MGEGNVGIRDYLARYVELCPDRAITLEVITIEPRHLRFMEPAYWSAYRDVRASELVEYLALAETRRQPSSIGAASASDDASAERHNLESNVRFCRNFFRSGCFLQGASAALKFQT
jgi:hypothetical protein